MLACPGGEFITLNIEKSYSSAAKQLGMSHTTLYRHIQSMEAEVGERLVLSSNPIVLTSAGKTVFGRAGSIVSEYDVIRRELEEQRATVCGDVRLLDMTSQNDTMPLVAQALYEVRGRYPGISAALIGPSSNYDVVEAVRAGELDIAFRYCWYRGTPEDMPQIDEPDGIAAVRLSSLRFPLAFGLGPEHPLYSAEGRSLADFARFGLLQPANRVYQDSNNSFTDFLRREGISPKLHYVEVTSLINLWLSGPGRHAFVLTDRMLPLEMLPRGFREEAKVVQPDDGPYWMETYAVVRRDAMSEATLTVLAALEDELG